LGGSGNGVYTPATLSYDGSGNEVAAGTGTNYSSFSPVGQGFYD
jgi:hypothetical protein